MNVQKRWTFTGRSFSFILKMNVQKTFSVNEKISFKNEIYFVHKAEIGLNSLFKCSTDHWIVKLWPQNRINLCCIEQIVFILILYLIFESVVNYKFTSHHFSSHSYTIYWKICSFKILTKCSLFPRWKKRFLHQWITPN